VTIVQADPTSTSPAGYTQAETLLLAAEQLNSAHEPEEVLLRVVQTAAELLSVERAAIATNEGDYALRRYTWDAGRWKAWAERLPLDDSLSGWVIRHGTAFRSDDVRTDTLDGHVLAAYRFRTVLAVPILSRDGQVLGSLNLHERHDGKPFTEDDQRLGEAIAHHAAVALERARLVAELRARAEEQEAFIHTVSHALKTPLSSVLAVAELLNDQKAVGAEAPADAVAIILRSAERMREIIDDLLGLARATAGLQDLAMGPVPLDAALETAEHELLAKLQTRNVQLTAERPLPRVYGHAGRLAEVFTNLIDNAIKYTPPERRPQVQVSASVLDGIVSCAVTDNGIGIPGEQREQIFQLFRRLDGARHVETSGSGVGLAVVARIIERHGGRIWVEDGPAGGSCFRFTLRAG
jgi:signal transduction histidine kinase